MGVDNGTDPVYLPLNSAQSEIKRRKEAPCYGKRILFPFSGIAAASRAPAGSRFQAQGPRRRPSAARRNIRPSRVLV